MFWNSWGGFGNGAGGRRRVVEEEIR
jgi:hypothetical protein